MESVHELNGRGTWVMILLAFSCLLVHHEVLVHASDPDPLQDFCVADFSANAPRVNGHPCKLRSNVTAADFLFTGLRSGPAGYASDPSITGTNATFTLATVTEFPGVNTQGISHLRLDFGIGGVIPVHTHPLAAETLFVLKGSIYTGFVSDDDVLYASTLQVGDLTIFPKGTQHFQLNVGNETAITFNTLTSQSPGFFMTANQVFETGIPSAVLEKSFGINAKTVKSIKGSVPRFFG